MHFTDEERQRMGLTETVSEQKVYERGWTADDFKRVLKERGFTVASFEREAQLPKGSLYVAFKGRYRRVDKILSGFLNIPLHELWPNQYLANGLPMNYRYRAETLSDEELAKLNHSVMNPQPKRVVTLEDWYPQQASLPPGIGD